MPQEAAHFLSSDPVTAHTAAKKDSDDRVVVTMGHSRSHGGRDEWPSKGVIAMTDVTMRYREGLPLVLKGMTLTINAHEKVGIAGGSMDG